LQRVARLSGPQANAQSATVRVKGFLFLPISSFDFMLAIPGSHFCFEAVIEKKTSWFRQSRRKN